MPAPQGTDLQIGWGFEKAENIWVPPAAYFFRPKSVAGMVAKRGYERSANLDPSGQTLKGIPATARIAPKVDNELVVDSISPMLAHWCGKEPTITTLATTAKQWVLTPREFSESAPATWRDSIWFESTDGDGYPVLVSGARMSEWEIKIADGKIVDSSMSYLACYDSYQSEATVVAGPATYTGKPILRGHRAEAQTGTLKLKVTAVAGAGYDGTVKFSLASYAGSTVIPFVFDTWYRVALDTGVRMGVNRFEDLWFCMPSAGVTTVAVNDEWSFTATRTLATASYSTMDVLSAAGMELSVGGSVIYVRDATVKITKPLKHNTVAGSKYPIGTQKNGPWAATISLNRDRVDRTFLEKIIRGDSVAVIVDLYGNPIAATGYDERIKINFPGTQVTDDQRDVTTPNSLPEKIDLMAFRSGSSDIFDLTIQNTLAAL